MTQICLKAEWGGAKLSKWTHPNLTKVIRSVGKMEKRREKILLELTEKFYYCVCILKIHVLSGGGRARQA